MAHSLFFLIFWYLEMLAMGCVFEGKFTKSRFVLRRAATKDGERV